MDYAQQLQRYYLDLIDEVKRSATPDIQRRVGYSSPLAAEYLQRRVAEPLLRDYGMKLADLLEQQRREEAQREFAREGWREQARQQQLNRMWQDEARLGQQAYEERVYARNLAEQRKLAEELARKQDEENRRAMLWQLIPNLLAGVGMAAFPAAFGLAGGAGLSNILGRGLVGLLGGPSLATLLGAQQLGYGGYYPTYTPRQMTPVGETSIGGA